MNVVLYDKILQFRNYLRFLYIHDFLMQPIGIKLIEILVFLAIIIGLIVLIAKRKVMTALSLLVFSIVAVFAIVAGFLLYVGATIILAFLIYGFLVGSGRR